MGGSAIPNRPNPLVDSANVLGQLAPIFLGSGKQKSNSTVTTNKQGLDPAITQLLQRSLTSGQYSKDAANKDSQLAMDATLRQIVEKFLPQIASQRIGSGIYDDTTTRLLQNDLATRAAGEASKIKLDTIKDYATINNQTASTLKDANVTETRQVAQTSKVAPTIENPLLAAGGLLATMAAPSLLGSLAKAIFSSGDGGGAGDYPPSASYGSKRKFNEDNFNDSSVDIANVITPMFESNSFGSNMSALMDPIARFIASPESSQGGTAQVSNYSSPSAFDSLAGGVAGELGSGSGLLDAVGTALSEVDISGFFGDLFGGGSGDSGCFITTAVCEVIGLPDDCEELQTLRKFRDTYMKSNDRLAKLVEQYYDQAPGIVAAIATKVPAVRNDLYRFLYGQFILPAVAAIKRGNNEEALSLYRELFEVAAMYANQSYNNDITNSSEDC